MEGGRTEIVQGSHKRTANCQEDLVMRTKAEELKESGHVKNVAKMYVQGYSEKYEDLS